MTDYEAVFEDIMQYMRGSPDENTERGLKRWLKDNDKYNNFSPRLLDQVATTNSAKNYLKDNDIEALRVKAVRQKADVNRQRATIKERFFAIPKKETYTVKRTGARKATFTNSQGKTVYLDEKVNRLRVAGSGAFARR